MSLKTLVNTKKFYEPLMKEVESQISGCYKSMEQAKDAETLFRLQGSVAALRRLLTLREKVNADD